MTDAMKRAKQLAKLVFGGEGWSKADLEAVAARLEEWRDDSLGLVPPHDHKPALRPHSMKGMWQLWSGRICVALLDDAMLGPVRDAALEQAVDILEDELERTGTVTDPKKAVSGPAMCARIRALKTAGKS